MECSLVEYKVFYRNIKFDEIERLCLIHEWIRSFFRAPMYIIDRLLRALHLFLYETLSSQGPPTEYCFSSDDTLEISPLCLCGVCFKWEYLAKAKTKINYN